MGYCTCWSPDNIQERSRTCAISSAPVRAETDETSLESAAPANAREHVAPARKEESLPDVSGVPEDIVSSIEATATRLEGLCASLDEWVFNFEKRGIKCYTRRGGSKLASGRGTGVIPFPPQKVLKFLIAHADGGNPKTFELDPDLKDMEKVVQWNEHTWMDYLTSKSIGPVSSRDFLNISHWRIVNGDQLLFFGLAF